MVADPDRVNAGCHVLLAAQAGKSRSGKDRRRNQEKCQGALLTVVVTWRKRRAHGENREYLEKSKWFCAHLVAL